MSSALSKRGLALVFAAAFGTGERIKKGAARLLVRIVYDKKSVEGAGICTAFRKIL